MSVQQCNIMFPLESSASYDILHVVIKPQAPTSPTNVALLNNMCNAPEGSVLTTLSNVWLLLLSPQKCNISRTMWELYLTGAEKYKKDLENCYLQRNKSLPLMGCSLLPIPLVMIFIPTWFHHMCFIIVHEGQLWTNYLTYVSKEPLIIICDCLRYCSMPPNSKS